MPVEEYTDVHIAVAYFLIRGDMNAHGSQTKPGFVTVATYGNPATEIPRPDGHTSGRRLALAQWLTSRENPLPARVMANRIWAHHFGRGIVPTLENFGKMGDPPTHPELLDWLAVEFMNRGWSLKQMHRLMMTSEAYQMASRYNDRGVTRMTTISGGPLTVTIDSIQAGSGATSSSAMLSALRPIFLPGRYSVQQGGGRSH